jgi:uncharacterized protein (TIGR03067 family)
VTPKIEIALALVALISTVYLSAVAASSNSGMDDQKGTGKTPVAPLEGGYGIVAGEENGKTVPPEHLKGSIVLFTADKIVGTDKDKKEIFSSSYVLDTNHTPWIIKMKNSGPKETEVLGLIKKEGDSVTVIYALPGGEAPKEFHTKDKQNMFVMKSLAKSDPSKP